MTPTIKMALCVAGLALMVALAFTADRIDRNERAAARRRDVKEQDRLTDEQVDRLLKSRTDHPAGHQPKRRYYR